MPHGTVEIPQFLAGVRYLLQDTTHGKRSIAWLAKQVNIARTTLDRKLNTGRIWMGEVLAISDALGHHFLDIIEIGARILKEEAAA